MLDDFLKSVRQLPHPAFRKVLLLALVATAATFVVLTTVVWMLVSQLAFFDIGWLNDLLAYGALLIFIVVLFLVFPSVATFIVSFFLDDIVDAVDARHYPNDAPGTPLAWRQSLSVSARFTAVVLLANFLVLPLYLLLLLFPPINLFIFYGLNGYLLSREYFELVALRHLDTHAAGRLRKANRIRVLAAGVVITFLLTVPVVNIAAPVIAAAFMEHIFRRVRARAAQ